MTDRNKNIENEEWRNREDQDLRKDVAHDEHIERAGRETDNDDTEGREKKIANIPGNTQADTSSRSSNNMTSGGLTNSRTSRERTRTSNPKTFITGTDEDGQSV